MNPTDTVKNQVEPVQQSENVQEIGCCDYICDIVNIFCLALCCGCDEDKE